MTLNPNIIGSTQAYQGFQVVQPNPARRPTINDTAFNVPTMWVYANNNTSEYEFYYLANVKMLAGGVKEANWILGGSTNGPLQGILVDTGISPVQEDMSGYIQFTCGQIANANLTNAAQFDGSGTSTATLQLQRSAASATVDTSLNGISHFKDDVFSVDSDGFVEFTRARSGCFEYVTVTGISQTAEAGYGYILTNTSLTSVSLPANVDTQVGDTFRVIGLSGGYDILQAADQLIIIGTKQSTYGATGYVSSQGSLFNAIELVCVSDAGGSYIWATVTPPQGNFILT